MAAAIIRIETVAWKLEIVGKMPELPPFVSFTANTRIEITGSGALQAWSRETGKLESVQSDAQLEPLIFENTDYDFYLDVKSGIASITLPPAAELRRCSENARHYRLNFKSNVGFVELRINSSETGTTLVRLEVFSLKIDYRSDYAQMRDDVAAITRNLVLAAQARTFGAASVAPPDNPTLVEWLTLARRYFKEMANAANAIARQPHSRLIKETVNVPADRARKVDERALSRLLRKPVARAGARVPETNIILPERVPCIVSRVTFDTPENRYVKALLLETRSNLLKLSRAKAGTDEDADLTAEEKFLNAAQPEAAAMLQQVQVLLNAPYLKQVAQVPPQSLSSMVFHQHPQYAAFIQAARLVNSGLVVDGGPLQVGVKQVWQLYEYWCFLKLVSLLSERFDLEQQNVVRIQHLKVTVVLKKGEESTIRFRDRATGKTLDLIYNRLFSRLPTVGQQPDNVIQLASRNDLHIFDAKYRVAFDAEYQKLYQGIGPTVDDINTMHRYRDAIVVFDGTQNDKAVRRIVQSAVILFPYPDEAAYRSHKFYRSLASVEIGGLPFLPQATTLVEEKLRDVLAQSGFQTG